MDDERARLADLLQIDREIAKAATARDPHAVPRWLAGQGTYETLRARNVAAYEVSLRDALARWVYAFLLARVEHDLEADEARARADVKWPVTLDVARLTSVREAWRGVVVASSRGEAAAWLDAVQRGAPSVAAVARERAARRLEVAHRLGANHPDDLVVTVPRESLVTFASLFLDATQDLADAMIREGRHEGERASATDAMTIAMARDAADGWPARLTWRWLADAFAPIAPAIKAALPELPPVVGAASFARGLAAFGELFRVAVASTRRPFALHRPPFFADAHRFAFVFAQLSAARAFQSRILGLSSRVAAAQARVLARTQLLEARVLAARYLLNDEAHFAPRDRFAELTARVFVAPLPSELAGAWPALRRDEAARVLALATALPFAHDLVERYDVDWFANPRAAEHLRALGSTPPDEGNNLDAPASSRALARAFEAALS